MKKTIIITLLGLLALGTFSLAGQDNKKATFSPYVTAKGVIQLPQNYRTQWVYLGSWVVPNEKAPGYGFHDVFTQPETVKAYKKSGKFPDGAVLVKEIRKVESGEMTTGDASWAGPIDAWFVMIKDQQGRFSNNPNWGDGWGWALFKPAAPDKNVSTSYQKDCLPCHVPAKNTDWVYTNGYVTLK